MNSILDEGTRKGTDSDATEPTSLQLAWAVLRTIGGTSHLHEDIEHPLGTLLYTISCMRCMTVSLAQGGEGLGAIWGEEKTREYLRAAGFRSVETHRLAHDVMNNWHVVKK